MSAEADSLMTIEVVYAEPDRQELIVLQLPEGTTAEAALAHSKLADIFPGVDFNGSKLGIWGQPVNRQHALREGDRLEVYRPLAMDPREARRQLATHGRAMGQRDTGED